MSSPNPYSITLARELRQVSQTALCKKLRIAQGTLSKVENEQMMASEDLIVKIADELGFPTSFFSTDVEFHNLPQTYFRKYKLNQTLTKAARAKINIMREQLKTLLSSVEPIDSRLPMIDLDEYDGSIEDLAHELRVFWNLAPGPVPNLTGLLEAEDVLVLECDFGTEKIDAVSMRDGELPPLIFIRPRMTGDRWRFTLAHELAHLIMHHRRFLADSTDDIEGEAHRFASAFLMPARDISSDFLGRLTLDKLARLKSYWKTSMQALVMRAADLRKITDSQKRRLFMMMGKRGWRREEPIFVEREEPTFAEGLLRYHQGELGYSLRELSRLLNIREEEIHSFYPGAIKKPLRLI